MWSAPAGKQARAFASLIHPMKKSFCVARPLWLAAASCVLSSTATAQTAPFELQPVTVTGSGTPRTLGSEIAATSVLTRGDIERSGARDAVTLLGMLGTALVEQQGGPGTLASVRIRGADTRDTLVLVDGVPLTDVTSGQALIQQIPADMIERIEVVRGNLSALHGANATGGVVQIFTRRGERGALRGHASASAGSRNTRALNASLAGGGERWSARIGVGGERTDGFSAADPAVAATANPDRDGNRRHHATLAADVDIASGHRLLLDLRRVEGKVQYDSTSSFSTPADTHAQDLEQTGGGVRGEHALGADWSLGWRWSESNEQREDSGSSAFGPFAFGNKLSNRIAGVDLNGALAKGWNLQLGVQRVAQTTDLTTYTRQRRDTDVLRAGTIYDAPWGTLQANVRHDRTSDYGSASTGLVGGQLRLGGGFSVFANTSTSFTPPSFDFLFYNCAPFVCSNPSLRPEKARSVELAAQWQDARTLVRATAFAVRYRDKIANDANFVPQNLNRVKNDGLELTLRHVLDAWTLVGEATFQDPVDEADGSRLIRRARQQVALRADYNQPTWHAGAAVRHVGDRRDGTHTLAAYTVLDASAHWNVHPEWSLSARIENLFDRRFEPARGYSGQPRGMFVGLSWAPRPVR